MDQHRTPMRRTAPTYRAVPIDQDVDGEPDAGAGLSPGRRAPHLRLSAIALVLVGGTLGTAARYGLGLALPSTGPVPYVTFGINVLGALLLGLLVGSLARRGPEDEHRHALRLLLGTGALGGFTTYSALATDTVVLVAGGSPGPAGAYLLGTVLCGALAAWTGLVLTARPERARTARSHRPRDVGPGEGR